MGRVSTGSLARRILARLEQAERAELNPHLQTDYRIAWLTVFYAWRGEAVECSPHVLATYKILHMHPDKVWPSIEEKRREQLGPEYDKIFGGDFLGGSSPKKPPQSVTLADLGSTDKTPRSRREG